ncbi:MBG domain-containing protein, partial [Echinicola salinicaeni]|uniref:MBG domain-containing protein n=1 Tax=Echinicola salinicaeni TaxID=2762757 RepID=UPI001647A16F
MKKLLILIFIITTIGKLSAQECAELSYEWLNPSPTTTNYNYLSARLTGIPDAENSTNPTDTKTIFEGFTSPTPGTTPVGGVTIGLGFLSDGNDNTRFDVMVYNDNSGRPGTQIGGVTGLSPTGLGVPSNSFKEVFIELPSLPVPTTSRFYVGVVMHPGDASDQLIVQANANGQGNGDNSNSISTTRYGIERILAVYSRDIDLKILPKLGVIEDASFSYSSSSYCSDLADPLATITGDGGGTFSSSPGGLVMNSSSGRIDLSISTPGTYIITYTTSGSCPVSETQTVTVVNDDPVITCPGNQNISLNSDCQFVLPDYTGLASATDNCSTPTISQSPAPGTVLSARTTITLTADDGNGNTDQCTFDVIPADDTAPTITCPVNQIVNIDGATSTTVPDYTALATVSDNCDANPTVTQSPAAGTTVGFGTTTITLTAEDASSNDAVCTFDMLVQDITAPSVTISSAASDPTNGAFTTTFTFSEDVTGFAIGDITVGNGTASNFSTTSASVYTVDITPTTDGTVTVDVAANVAEDAATNGNTAATQFSLEADLTAPTVNITSTVADPTNGRFNITFTFSEELFGFTSGDIVVGNGTKGYFSRAGTSAYVLYITPITDGTVTVNVPANIAQDEAGNGNTAAAQFSVEADLTAPTVDITSTESDPTNGAFIATFTFSEDVTGFTVGDITVGNGTASNFSAISASVYTADITPTTDGTLTIDVAANVTQDAATNGNTAATQFSVEADLTATLDITVDAGQTKVYGDTDPVLTYQVSGLKNGDTEGAVITGSLSRSAGEDVGTYAINLGTLSAVGNYVINFIPADFEITSATLDITADAGQSKIYGDTDPVLTYQVSGLKNGDTEGAVTIGSLSRSAGEDVGTYAINLGTLSAVGNYVINFIPADFEITSATLDITADAGQSKIYGDTDPVLTYQVSGLKNGDTEGGVVSGSLTRIAGEDVGMYAIQQGTIDAGANYAINFISSDFAITPSILTVTADAGQNKVYGDTDPVFTYQVSGYQNGDDASVLTGALARTAGEDVGTYPVNLGTLDAGPNYLINYTGADYTIGEKILMVTADVGQTKIYGYADPILDYQVTGFENGDNSDILTGTLERTLGEDAGTYVINLGTLDAGPNYTINFTSADFEITPAALTVTADDQGKVYGETDPALTVSYSGFVNGDDETALGGTLAISRAAGEEVGTYVITASGYTSGNYIISYMDGSFEITEAALTVTADDQSKVYGETDPVLTVSYAGFVNGDDETALGGSLDVSRTAGEDVGTYAITASGYTSSNYTISYVDGSFEITKAALTVTADNQSKVYGETDPALTVSYSGFVNGDDETALGGTLDVSRAAGEDVGTYAITASGYTSGNYTISYIDGSFEITQAALAVTADDQSKVYGTVDPALTVSYAGFVNGDDETALGGTLGVSRVSGEDVGTYAITASGYTSSNYTISYMDGSFEITQAALTITADDQSKVYGTADPGLTVSYSGFVNGDDATALGGTLDVSRAAGEDVGNYAITVSGYTSSNYTISYVDGNFDITQAALTVTADDQSKVYGIADPALTVSYSGFVNGDDETALGGTLDVSRATGEDVGTYAITASGYTSSNYTISYTDGSFEITQAALTVTADDQSKVYGTANPGLTVSYSGFVNGDDATALGGTLDVSRATGEDVGNYVITASGYTSSNYTISYVGGNFAITQAALTVTADDQSKVYGTADPGLTVSYSGFVNGDDETALGGTLAIGRAAGEDVGNYAITSSGYTSGNYTISYVDGSFEITKAALTVTADDQSKVYGDTDPSLTVSYIGFVNGDDETALGGTLDVSRTAGEDVGDYTITASGYTSGNYTISYVDGSFEITQAALTITADDKSKVYGATDPSITVSYSGFMNGDDETALGGTLDVSRAAGEEVGTYAITVSGYTSGNYTISYVDGSFEITQAALTVTADDKSKVYGDTEPSLTVSYSGFVNGDDETALGGTLDVSRTAGEDVGNYTITASGYTSGNYTISYVDGNFAITPAALTVTADDQSKVYGDAEPSLTVSYSGFVNGDDETVLGGTLDVSRAAGEDVGTYPITASGYTSGNYTISYIDGSFEITQAALTVTADDQSKVYGDTDPALTVSYAGFVNGDDETALGGTLDVSRTAGEDVGTYAITASGYTSGNYSISYVDGSFAITQAALTVTADDQSKVYGTADPALTVSYAGFVNGDTETTLGGTLDISRAAGEDVGNYAITASGYTSSNYTISYVDGNLEISQADLSVVA